MKDDEPKQLNWLEMAQECEDCGTTKGVEHVECPFAAKIKQDYTLHYLCPNCQHERAQDI